MEDIFTFDEGDIFSGVIFVTEGVGRGVFVNRNHKFFGVWFGRSATVSFSGILMVFFIFVAVGGVSPRGLVLLVNVVPALSIVRARTTGRGGGLNRVQFWLESFLCPLVSKGLLCSMGQFSLQSFQTGRCNEDVDKLI